MALIDHPFLDRYVAATGDPERLERGHGMDMAIWERVDELLLDLHLIRHGYAEEGYSRHVDRELDRHCADASVAQRMKDLRL